MVGISSDSDAYSVWRYLVRTPHFALSQVQSRQSEEGYEVSLATLGYHLSLVCRLEEVATYKRCVCIW